VSKTATAVGWVPSSLGDLSDAQVHSISEIVATALIHIAPTSMRYTLASARPRVKVAAETAAWVVGGAELLSARVLTADIGSGPTGELSVEVPQVREAAEPFVSKLSPAGRSCCAPSR
jgi:hypothetical protein